ncbi:MAG: ABC transporter ATP-binding protein [Candidatus Thiodiazotropha lotti]|uniref:ABC transporter ATP-binding protein n=1 Tax=Candidatus Thiodiazotropha endoloripes TaxID=1818881 RepID=UPI00083E25B2|nr:ABC transporter ATP-binding protein [Candidatus Thiodiazotropha endoloripes]MCG7904382.1 ABC transporter ATP-binding protein [Candidatus Thiodiazotropha weberae]MCG7990642.1 ABC transporter ATP-binding protein [Candidatus Thiodiazotropha lotti]MCG7915674.1 ABC transporter ATP-binding protein [Candidatus Thiodiazotropha weberae]MCG7999493.1 ABC transporter ATP-binding protein [Candidatus Thiodiazotropha lotti]MCW4182296.1 ABC transporter ATP-binding protein [Candidatus Thiodiazotropha webera
MPQTAAILLKDLRFGWRKNLPEVLHIADLEVPRGERIFIGGASGSGKSTLLALLAGVNLPTRGEVTVLGETINRLSGARRDHFRSDHIGFVFQLFNLIPYLSVLENVTLPCRFSQLRKQKATESSGDLHAEAMRLLTHLDMAHESLIHRPVTELSVGQQQRVATARALIGAPEIIIADEPTSALDSDMRQAFLRLLFQECDESGSTLLFVSHDRQLASLFERHIALDELNQADREGL